MRLLRVAGDRAAMAIEHARLREQRHLAEALQRTLMPAVLPESPGVRIAGRYLPAPAGAELGGDWYDTLSLPDGRLAVVVGDVVGRGIPAATLMAQLRTAVRAFASEGHGPAASRRPAQRPALPRGRRGHGDGGLPRVRSGDRPCHRGQRRPPAAAPRRRRWDGRLPRRPGRPAIGAARIAHFQEHVFDIPLGSLVLLYTDGLVERRHEPLDAGLARLKSLAAGPPQAPQAFCDRLLSALADDAGPEDDIALIAMQTLPLGAQLELRLPANPEVLSMMRRQLARWLKENDVDDQVAFDIVLACSEASANATEHAYPPREGHFDVKAVRDGDHVVIRVSDDGTWRPEGERGRGRGLLLMRGLTDEVSVDRREPDGTVVTLRRRVTGAPR